VYLKTPNATRWNSEFDSVNQVNELAKEKPEVLNSVFDAVGLNRLTPTDQEFLAEFTTLMGSVAMALDILQGEKNMYYGYLVPTIVQLKRRIESAQTSGEGLKHCNPLAKALLDGISKRFDNILDNDEAILAACVHPLFKFDWIDDRRERKKAEKIVKAALITEAKLQGVPATATAPPDTTDRATSSCNAGGGFFNFASKRAKVPSPTTAEEAAELELEKFLETSEDVKVLIEGFPLLKKVFIRSNTPLPSSAAVERLFSLSGLVLSSLRGGLSDDHLEMLILLKANACFVDFQC